MRESSGPLRNCNRGITPSAATQQARQRLSREKVAVEMYSRTGRAETRKPISVLVRIASLEHQGLVDSGTTENVSALGLRVIVASKWPAYEPVVIESPPGFIRSRAWVVYCKPAKEGDFAIGLRLLTAQPNWALKV
jgi:hypothetical protein